MANPNSNTIPDSSSTETFGDAFITPDGRIWSCHHGVHGFVVEQIVADLGLDGVRGSLILLAEGMWFQEQATDIFTVEQRAAIELLAQFPECGIKTAATAIQHHIDDMDNEAARRRQSAARELLYGFRNSFENGSAL